MSFFVGFCPSRSNAFCKEFLGAGNRADLFFIFFKTRYSREPRPQGGTIRSLKKIKKRKKAAAKVLRGFLVFSPPRLLGSWRYGVSAKLKYFSVLTSRLCLSKKAKLLP